MGSVQAGEYDGVFASRDSCFHGHLVKFRLNSTLSTVTATSSSLSPTMAVAVQRPLRGSRVSSFYPVKSIPSLSSLDSAFQLQEYISLLIRLDVHDVDSIVSLPGKAAFKDSVDKSSDLSDAERKPDDAERKSDITVDRGCWIYEQLRYF
jgi:hypothetical protein